MFKWMLITLLVLFYIEVSAAFVPHNPTTVIVVNPANAQQNSNTLSIEEFEERNGKKLNAIEKWQYKKLQKKLNKNRKFGIFPQRDDLTEGFRALPFFGGIVTLGILPLIMLFTARDRNSLNWAFNGGALVLGVLSLIITLSGN